MKRTTSRNSTPPTNNSPNAGKNAATATPRARDGAPAQSYGATEPMSRGNQPAPASMASGLGKAGGATLGKPSVEEIRRRAYEIYLARKGVNGTPDSDWAQAERELIAEHARARGGVPVTR